MQFDQYITFFFIHGSKLKLTLVTQLKGGFLLTSDYKIPVKNTKIMVYVSSYSMKLINLNMFTSLLLKAVSIGLFPNPSWTLKDAPLSMRI